MFKILDSILKNVPLEGWRTIILGYLATTLPALIQLAEESPSGVLFYWQLAMILAGPLIHYYRRQADGVS